MPAFNSVFLADIISLEFPLILALVQEHVLKLRLVSKKVMVALESNTSLNIKIRISVAGMDNLSAEFLRRWNGRVQLECKHPCIPDSRWFNTVKDALMSTRLRPLSLLSLSIHGKCLHRLVKTLVAMGNAIQQLKITYCGNGKNLLAAAAPIESLGRSLTMKISVECRDRGGRQMSLWLQRLVGAGIRINSMSFRSVPVPALPARFRPPPPSPESHGSPTSRLLLQRQRSGGRGGDCANIGADGSDGAPVDRLQVRRREEGRLWSGAFDG